MYSTNLIENIILLMYEENSRFDEVINQRTKTSSQHTFIFAMLIYEENSRFGLTNEPLH